MNVENAVSGSKQEKSKKLLFESLKKRTNFYFNKPVLEDIDLYHYVKDFFKDYFDTDHELSFGEIKQEIDKIYIQKEIKENIIKFVDKIKDVEYIDTSLNDDSIKSLIKEFYDIAKNLPLETNKESFFNRFLIKVGLKKKPESADVFIPSNYESKSNKINITFKNDASVVEDQEITEEKSLDTSSIVDESYSDSAISDTFESGDDNSFNYSEKREKSIPDYLKNVTIEDDFTKEISLNSEPKNKVWIEEIDHKKTDKVKSENEFDVKEKTVNSKEEIKAESDVWELLDKSKRLRSKDKLIDLYKEINRLYEQESIAEKSKIYPELISLYEKIAKS